MGICCVQEQSEDRLLRVSKLEKRFKLSSIPLKKYFHILNIAKLLPEALETAFEDTEELKQVKSVFSQILHSKHLKTHEMHWDLDDLKLALIRVLYCWSTDTERAAFLFFLCLDKENCVKLMNDYLTSPKLETPPLEFTGQNGIILKKIE